MVAESLHFGSVAHPPWQRAFARFAPVVTLWRTVVVAVANPAVKRTAYGSRLVSLLGSIMFAFFRLIRGICGFIFASQIIGLLPIITWAQEPNAVTGEMWALVFIKLGALLIFGWLFIWLRCVINRLHVKKFGKPHPALANKKWAL